MMEEGLRLGSNQLTGSIPVQLGLLSLLTKDLFLAHNAELCEEVPLEVQALEVRNDARSRWSHGGYVTNAWAWIASPRLVPNHHTPTTTSSL